MSIKNWIQRTFLSDSNEQIAKLTLRLASVEQELADARVLFDPEDYLEKGALDGYVTQDDFNNELSDYVKNGNGLDALCTELDMQSYVDDSISSALTDLDLSDYLYFTELRDRVDQLNDVDTEIATAIEDIDSKLETQADAIKRLQDIVDGALDISVLAKSVAQHGNLASMDDIAKLRQEIAASKLSIRRVIQAQVMNELLERVQTILCKLQGDDSKCLTEDEYDELCAIVTEYEQL
jgi:hypothetical protein